MKIGAGQEEYTTIHAMPIDGREGEVIAMFRLTEEEIRQIVETKTIFYSRLTFHNVVQCEHCNTPTKVGFQPMRMTTEPPKIKVKLIFDSGEPTEVDGEVRHDGVHVFGYTKTPEGKYVKD